MNDEELYKLCGITSEELDKRVAEYESDDWSGMRFGEVINGRPRIFEEPLDSITVKVPHSRVLAMQRMQSETGITKSEFVRRAIDHELVAMA